MNKRIVRLLMAFGIVGLSGCGQLSGAGEPDITGYVTEVEDGRILVVNPEAGKNDLGTVEEETYDAAWAGLSEDNIRVGQLVEVWFRGGTNESYPVQATAGRIKVITPSAPGNAELTEAQAIEAAIKEFEARMMIPTMAAVTGVSFDVKRDEWLVELKEAGGSEETEQEILIRDTAF
ncbi:DUF3221 domain-containing protein [Planococcus lenghuensis]|uniref:DUF3221 domain-containing protein n=1 Tax=Planococcus lenghuensis TaxID=2213202 RepID=A0A1Q2L0R0_9BACL|nr:DUF3221 domain-containing protein [Planococcus lenghuensis]AQQ53482.1 hypothetical protein B0X71_10625 [Planococcus lenghuensis]